MKNIFQDLKEHAIKITNYVKKEMILLANEERKLYCKQKVCYICEKKI